MTQERLSHWLRVVIVTVSVCGSLAYAYVLCAVLAMGTDYFQSSPVLPALFVFLLLTALPIAIALVLAWKITGEIGRDNSFSRTNASHMKHIAYLALADVIYFQVGILVFGLLGLSDIILFPMVLLAIVILDVIGLAIAVCAGALSHLILKAAMLREENDMTI